MTNKREIKFEVESASMAQKVRAVIKKNWPCLLLGGLLGVVIYGGIIVLTTASVSVLGMLGSIFMGASLVGVGKKVKDLLDKIRGKHKSGHDNTVQEDQIIVLRTRAKNVQKNGLSIEKALSQVRVSQFYWVGTKTDWERIKKNFDLSAPLNACPENEFERLLVIYSVKGPNEPISFSKGGIMGFLRNYAHQAQGEQGLLYANPSMEEGNIMTYGFKSE